MGNGSKQKNQPLLPSAAAPDADAQTQALYKDAELLPFLLEKVGTKEQFKQYEQLQKDQTSVSAKRLAGSYDPLGELEQATAKRAQQLTAELHEAYIQQQMREAVVRARDHGLLPLDGLFPIKLLEDGKPLQMKWKQHNQLLQDNAFPADPFVLPPGAIKEKAPKGINQGDQHMTPPRTPPVTPAIPKDKKKQTLMP